MCLVCCAYFLCGNVQVQLLTPGKNTTGFIGPASTVYSTQQSAQSNAGGHTPNTPPPVVMQDPLKAAIRPTTPTHPAPPRIQRGKSIPCLTPGCEFYGREDTEFYCSKCSSQRQRAATIPRERSKTEPQRLRPLDEGDVVQRQLDMGQSPSTAIAEETTAPSSSTHMKCKHTSCKNPGSDEFQGYCSWTCILEMTKSVGDQEDRERAVLATLDTPLSATLPPNIQPQRSQSMIQQHVTRPVEYRTTARPAHRVCRSMGCNQPALGEFHGFCLYCYQSKTTSPFYNDGAERCLNATCSRNGEQAYGGFCQDCFYRTTSAQI